MTPEWNPPSCSTVLASGEVHVWRARTEWREAGSILLRLLARYAGLAADEIRLARTPQGKPFLPGSPLRFNLSHTSGLSLFAFARETDVGVDVEAVRAHIEPLAIAERFFAPAEIKALREREADARLELFYRLWVRKEAYVKGIGGGLTLGLSGFTVSPQVDIAEGLPVTGGGEWRVWDLSVGSDHAAALAVNARECRILGWEYGALQPA